MTDERISEAPSEERRARRTLTLKQVLRIVPLGRSTLLRMERDGRFPKGLMLSGNRKAWFEDEIADWLESRPRAA